MNYKILTDDAVLEDKSKNLTHKSIAGQLYTVISDSDTPGLTIGLEGKWGSGKSTVIKILNEKLKGDEDTFVFYIDTWAHEGDPLRRIFLESFIERIKQIPTYNELQNKEKENLDKIQSKIQYKQKTTIISKIPEIDTAGKITAALAFLVPLGTVMIEHGFETLTFERGYPLNWSFILGCLFTCAPLLVSILFGSKGMKFFKNRDVDTTTEVSNEEEKSSVDFNLRFVELQNYLAEKLNIKKIVCVIDNLDRIKEADALKIWSTLQTFVQGKNSKIDSSNEKIKFFVLVPYDEQGLRKLWDGKPITPNKKNNDSCSNSFFNKNFQLRIYVPQLIISDWDDFAKKQIDYAVSNWSAEERLDMLNVLECTRESLGDAPTLREIKIYINQVAFLYPLHKKNVLLKSLCYYVVLKYLKFKDYDTILHDLREGTIPDVSMDIYCNRQDLIKELCSILFMVSKEEGMQLLLQEPVQKALTESPNELGKLKGIHGESFFTVLNYILANEKELDIHKSVINLYQFLKDGLNEKFDILKRFIVKESVQTRIFSDVCKYSREFWEIYIALIKDNKTLIDNINKYFSDNTEKFLVQENTENDFILILYTVIVVLEKSCSITIDYKKISFVGFEKIFNVLYEKSNTLIEKMISFDSFDKDIAAKIDDEKSDKSQLFQMIQIQINLGKIKIWTNTLNAVYKNLTKSSMNEDVFVSNLKILGELQKYKYSQEDDESTKKVLKEQCLWNNVYFAKDLNEKYIIYNMFYKYTDDIPKFTIQQLGNSQYAINNAKSTLQNTNHDIAKYFYEISMFTDDYNHYWKLVENPAYKLIGEIIKIAANSNNKNFFMKENPYKNLKNAVRVINKEDISDIVRAFIENSALEQELINNEENFDYINNPYITINIIEQTKNKSVITKLSKEITDTDENTWTAIFTSKRNDVLDVPIALSKKSKQFILGENFYKACEKFIIDSATTVSFDSEKLVLLFNMMEKNWKKEFSIQMEKKLLDLKFIVSSQVQQFCINSIKLEYLINEHKTDFSDLIKTYIETQKEDVLRFIVDLIDISDKKFIPEERYSEILKTSVEKLKNDDLKASLSKIFNIK